MSYRVLVDLNKVKEYLDDLQEPNNHESNILQLSNNPYPGDGKGDMKQIRGTSVSNKLFRLRSGDHRGIYLISDKDNIVKVFDFGHKENIESKYP